MRTYLLRRLLISIPLVFLMTFVIFAVINLNPQTALDRFILNPNISFQVIEQVKEQTGFYDIMPVRYAKWLSGVLFDIQVGRSRRSLVSFADPRRFPEQFQVEIVSAEARPDLYTIRQADERQRPYLAIAFPAADAVLALRNPGSPHVSHRLRRTNWKPHGRPEGLSPDGETVFSKDRFRRLRLEAGNPSNEPAAYELRLVSETGEKRSVSAMRFELDAHERAVRSFPFDRLEQQGVQLESVQEIEFAALAPSRLTVYRMDLELDEPAVRVGGRPNFGRSHDNIPVIEKLAGRIRNTVGLVVAAMAITWMVALPAGIVAALRQYGLSDRILSFLTFVGMALPSFFLAVLVRYLLQETANPDSWLSFLPTLPNSGRTSIHFDSMTPWQQAIDLLRHAIAPTLVLAMGGMAGMQRVMRGTMLETQRQQFIVTARAKGLPERTVIFKHALRNAITPFVAGFGSILPALIGGSLFVEMVFNYPGVGQMMYPAVLNRDLNLVMANTLIAALLLVLGNLIADMLLAVVDPRVSYD